MNERLLLRFALVGVRVFMILTRSLRGVHGHGGILSELDDLQADLREVVYPKGIPKNYE